MSMISMTQFRGWIENATAAELAKKEERLLEVINNVANRTVYRKTAQKLLGLIREETKARKEVSVAVLCYREEY